MGICDFVVKKWPSGYTSTQDWPMFGNGVMDWWVGSVVGKDTEYLFILARGFFIQTRGFTFK